MSNDIERKKRLRRFKKAQKILDMPHSEFVANIEKLKLEEDPELLRDYSEYLDSLVNTDDPSALKYIDYYRFKAVVDECKSDDVIDYLSLGEPSFAPYDPPYNVSDHDLSERVDAYLAASYFRESHNRYFVIERFCELVHAKISPPAWILEALAQGFSRHLKNPDPEELSGQLGLRGQVSGKTNPYKEYRRIAERRQVCNEMLILIRGFGASKINAAKAVKLKYKLKASEKTLCNNYREFEKESEEAFSDLELSLNSKEQQQFIQRFPVSARKLIGRKAPAKK